MEPIDLKGLFAPEIFCLRGVFLQTDQYQPRREGHTGAADRLGHAGLCEELRAASVRRRHNIPENELDRRHFQQLFSEIPDEYWEIAEKVVDYGRERYKIKVSDRVILPLCDHMAGSVERYKKGTTLANPMLWDIKRVYADEFQIGKYALEILEERFGVKMKEDEAAFLAYHFVNAELGSLPNVSPDSMAKLIGNVLDIVQESFQVTLNDEDWNYQRFVTHLKFFAARIVQRDGYQDEADDELFEELSERTISRPPHIA